MINFETTPCFTFRYSDDVFVHHRRREYDVATSDVSFYKKPTAPRGSHLSIFRLGPKYLPHFRADSRTLDWLPDDPARSGSDNSSIARPSWPANSFMFCFRELIRKQISLSLFSFVYLINAWYSIFARNRS